VFSLVPRLSTRHCPHSLLNAVQRRRCRWAPAPAAAVDRYLLPAVALPLYFYMLRQRRRFLCCCVDGLNASWVTSSAPYRATGHSDDTTPHGECRLRKFPCNNEQNGHGSEHAGRWIVCMHCLPTLCERGSKQWRRLPLKCRRSALICYLSQSAHLFSTVRSSQL